MAGSEEVEFRWSAVMIVVCCIFICMAGGVIGGYLVRLGWELH